VPTYHYHCKECGYEFERFSSITSYSKELECPVCRGKASLSISGGTGMIFKGSGFYITDYQRKNSYSSGNGKDSKKEDKKE
jgi:putative FmdB family regulatory protein